MQKQLKKIEAFKLVGISTRTNNHSEVGGENAKIMPLVQKYFENQIASKIKNPSNQGVTYCAYTNYASDENGDYTFFIGEEVSSLEGQDLENLETLTIEGGDYQVFTTEAGQMPNVCINAWQKIWGMNQNDFEGQRAYKTDFEVYDHRALDPQNTVLDIWIGIKP